MEEGLVWKTRDAAEELLNERRLCWSFVTPSTSTSGHVPPPPAERNSGSGGRGRGKGATAHLSSRSPGSTDAIMPVRDEFDLTGLKQRLFHGRSAQIRKAFHYAATCVLKALTESASSSSGPPVGGASSAAALLPSSSAVSATTFDDPDLPATVRDWIRLEARRRDTFDRTRNNKEYIKKKKSTSDLAAVATAADPDDPDAVVPVRPASSAALLAPGSGEKPAEQAQPSSSPSWSVTDPTLPAAVTSDAPGGGGPTATATSSASASAPKFTRNTPASSAAALDFRFNSSRAILCAAGNLVFDALTPPPRVLPASSSVVDASESPSQQQQQHLDPLSVPQNPAFSKAASKKSGTGIQVNMGAVVVEAQLLSQRTVSVVENAMRRAHLRHLYRVTNAECESNAHDKDFLQCTNPYLLKAKTNTMDSERSESRLDSVKGDEDIEDDDDDDLEVERLGVPHHSNPMARTEAWQTKCLPRLLAILDRGAGHAIYHDYHWTSRHGRLADLLHKVPNRYGPHLIVTIEPDVRAFCREFENGHISRLIHRPSMTLRAVAYHGTAKQRRVMRTRYFRAGKGLATSPWHVMVTSYGALLDDFLHFSQMPFDSVILDDGMLWMAAAHGDPNSGLGSIWENLFAKNDQQIGLAGTTLTDEYWNFALDGRELPESIVKDGWVGITCRHRIMTSSVMSIDLSRGGQDKVPVSGLLSFVVPHFADVVREEWDRSRIASDADSMAHFRSLVARSTVAHFVGKHDGLDPDTRQESQAMLALNGKLESKERADPVVPEYVYDDSFVSDGKINFSRRSCLAWLGRNEKSWLRYELGKAMLQHILDAMKVSNRHGHICEEITTASSTTSSGATGQVAGTMAYRLAIRCCRHFGSEQGLRQHVSALHAPPGTWLCRTCGSDCISNQARTHHERSCGVPGQGSIHSEPSSTVGAVPTVGQGSASKSGAAKKKPGRSSSTQLASNAEEKDPDGSFRVPGYRGVWVDKFGKHFVKIGGVRLKKDGEEDELLLFDSIDDAARKHDEILKKEKKGKLELNFKPDGSRIVYEDISPSSTSGLGGSATTVVPALSIINIKDLPPDVKPLLRDPRQTSRTGGNSKRHVYAYRGVCRQARKGHDRWQSQISFMGVNHYLGTFDSEWDAAAIYAWAHLILYGEEATRQAQKEGEEAAAAYEREQKDIAAGKLPEPSPKKKPKKPAAKKEMPAPDKADAADSAPKPENAAPKKRKSIRDATGAAPEKKAKTNTKACKLEKEAIGSTVAKGVTRASVIAPKEIFEDFTDDDLLPMAATKIRAAKDCMYCVSDLRFSLPAVESCARPCLPVKTEHAPLGGAQFIGLSPSEFGWDLQDFLASQDSGQDMTVIQMLAVEYDEDGVNEKFASVMQGTVCFLGRAGEVLQKAYKNLGLGSIPLGGSVGKLDCHVGGVPGSCGESAACIRYDPTVESSFRISCFSDDEVVTLNGCRISVANGSLPLRDEDVLSVGARVFAFVQARDKTR